MVAGALQFIEKPKKVFYIIKRVLSNLKDNTLFYFIP